MVMLPSCNAQRDFLVAALAKNSTPRVLKFTTSVLYHISLSGILLASFEKQCSQAISLKIVNIFWPTCFCWYSAVG